jgi:hypothetical protein
MERRSIRGRGRRRGGFTLVEVAVATVLLVFGLLALAEVAFTIRSMTRADRERALAGAALLEQARAIETTPFAQIVTTHNGRSFTVTIDGQATPALRALPGDLDGMPGSISVVAPTPPNDPFRLLEATLSLDWQGSFGPQRMQRRIRIAHSGANP